MLGACYYPEHWPEERWADDARRMADLGLAWVRVGEFSWSRLEPKQGLLRWDWLDRILALLGDAGLKVVLGTPTATPPAWIVRAHPSILPVGDDGRVRRFGSRRHYCFSNQPYREECRRMVALMGERYGRHEAVGAWQIDNEYGCHDTVACCCPRCEEGFRLWLEERYGEVEALNEAWGTVFWSQEYQEFAEVGLPVGTVTEAHPAHRMDAWRFANETVRGFHRVQVLALRQAGAFQPVTHNFMGFFTELDAFELGRDLDFASWDSYPLGFTDQMMDETGPGGLPRLGRDSMSPGEDWLRTGHPDVAAFHHDLYRGVRPRWWVMEQQPGPVNWAPFNPAPRPGMIRLWTWEALAHGAEVVSYFRWRQAPFAQEQFHAGLNRPDGEPSAAFSEVAQVARELREVGDLSASGKAPVALVFDYESDRVFRIQPQGRTAAWLDLAWRFYKAVRGLGFDVDMVPPGASLEGYRLVVAPSLALVTPAALRVLEQSTARVVLGPRSGSRESTFRTPEGLPPGALRSLLPLRVVEVESLRPGSGAEVAWRGRSFPVDTWVEGVETELEPEAFFGDGRGAAFRSGRFSYLAFWPSPEFLASWLEEEAREAGLEVTSLPPGLRLRRRGPLTFAFNSAAHPQPAPAPSGARFVLGGAEVPPFGVSAWEQAHP